MPARLAENALQTLFNFVSANLNAEITLVKASYGNVQLPTIPAQNFYYGARHNLPEFPCCIVWHSDPASTLEQGQFGNTFAIVRHDLVIEVGVNGALESDMNHMTLQYAEACWNLIYKNQSLGGAVMSAQPVDIGQSRVENHKQQVLLQSGAVRVTVRTAEQWP